ncbi:HD-GYP domain-containing protein [Halanaerobium kushneri]|uniref:HD domain-containing protein n=1 Tax=Halanaerobium kushneri TaxID=56779 RepID=A0A1N6WMV0_9FIRM|nr:HD domain-containing phosphohydrolase [Halanaerobium kushneri]SIQ91409.1 HD domain-containing protein [Halanaerobium kushneri]
MQNINYAKNLKYDYNYAGILKKIIKNSDPETYKHSQRLKRPALKLAAAMELSRPDIRDLLFLAELHDLGKSIIDKEILNKNGPLNNKEWIKIKEHPMVGFQMAYNSLNLINVAEGILTHHEWWNGSGYPLGIEGEAIPLIARIIAVVDAYDVMKYGRNYRDAMTDAEIINELKKSAGSQFDPLVVEKFIDLICSSSMS